jgi:hypothetical protein
MDSTGYIFGFDKIGDIKTEKMGTIGLRVVFPLACDGDWLIRPKSTALKEPIVKDPVFND